MLGKLQIYEYERLNMVQHFLPALPQCLALPPSLALSLFCCLRQQTTAVLPINGTHGVWVISV